jgi:hypothetical protein
MTSRRLLIQAVVFAVVPTVACLLAGWRAAPDLRVELALLWFVGVFGPTMFTRKLAKALAPSDQWLAIGPLLTGAVTSISALSLLRW